MMRMAFYCAFLLLFLTMGCRKAQKEIKSDSEPSVRAVLLHPNASVDSLEWASQHTKNDSLRIEAKSKLFFRYIYHDSIQAKKYYSDLLQLGIGNTYAKAKAYNLLGIYQDVYGEYNQALESYNQAIAIAKNRYPNVEGSSHNNIGLIHWNRGNYLDALQHYKKSLALFEKTGNHQYQANILSNIGLIYMDLKNLEASEEYIHQALAKRREIQDRYGISVSLTNLAKVHQQRKEYEKSMVLHDSAIVLKKQLRDDLGLSNTLYNQALNYQMLNRYDRALELLKEAEKICLEKGFESNNLTNIYAVLGDIYAEKKAIPELEATLDRIKNLVDNLEDDRNLIFYYELKSRKHQLQNDYKSALIYSQKADSVKNKVQGLELKKSIHLYETQYRTAQKENDLAQAQLKIASQNIQSKQKNTLLILLGAGLLLGFYLYRNALIKNRQRQKQLELENELTRSQSLAKIQEQRLEISRDLHDSLGAQLTFMVSLLDTVKSETQNKEPLHSKIRSLSEYAENAIQELKNTLWILHTETIYLDDLKNKILNFVSRASDAVEDLHFNLQFDWPENRPIPSHLAVHLFRMIQEILSNSIKHAHAKTISLHLKEDASVLELQMSDDGKGFDWETAESHSYGLSNIRQRTEILNGSLDFKSHENQGTQYTFKIPLP